MSENKIDLHKKYAVDCFNATWDLLDKTSRTLEEDHKMIHMAHASRYHWGEIGTPIHFTRGDWQISRVYAVLGMGEMAFKYAETCLEICLDNEIGDFDLAFAYEALLRANAVLENRTKMQVYKAMAIKNGNKIKKEGDRNYFFNQLKTIPGIDDL
jgi:hypothetical protein